MEEETERKTIEVSCALILREHEGKREIFATSRGYGDWKGWWEFPGGKLEKGETPSQCVVREIKEELETEIKPLKDLGVVEYDYPDFHLVMHCIVCSVVNGSLKLVEAQDSRWLTKETLNTVKWLPADEMIFYALNRML